MRFWAIFLSVLACTTIGSLVLIGIVFWDRTQPNDPKQPTVDIRTEISLSNESLPSTASTEQTASTKPVQGAPSSETPFLPNPTLTASDEATGGTKGIEPQTLGRKKGARKSFLPLSSLSCQNDCAQFSDEKEKRYCREFCGLEQIESAEQDCEKRSGLEKDYCLKDSAISNTDIESCRLVQDGNIHESCVNRVVEDFMEENTGL